MRTKFKTLIFGTLVAASLVLSAGPASARDWDRPINAHPRFHNRDYHQPRPRYSAPRYPAGRYPDWGYPAARVPVPAYPPAPYPSYGYPAYGYPVAGPAYGQDLYAQLENARRKVAYDASHHASREQIANDNRRIARLERELGIR